MSKEAGYKLTAFSLRFIKKKKYKRTGKKGLTSQKNVLKTALVMLRQFCFQGN